MPKKVSYDIRTIPYLVGYGLLYWLPVISSQSDFVTNHYVTNGILSTEKPE